MINLSFIIPEIFISLSVMFLLILGVFKKNSFELIHNLSIIVLLITGVIVFNETLDIEKILLFNGSVVIDYLSSFMKIITLLAAFIVLAISKNYLDNFKISKIEYPILILSSVLGMMVMISSNDLIVFYMGLELQSLALYVLATFNRNNLKSSEAGLKYFVLSALSSGLLLYGCSLIYGFSGSTNFEIIASQLNSNEYALTFGIVFILVGLAFKISAVPFHMWAPDVYEGSPTTVTLFFTMVPKIAALTVFIRFLYVPFLELIDQWQMILVFLSIASMLFGAIAAIGQKNIKRLIAYSSIGHIGYALAGVASASNDGIQSSVIYLTIYIVMNLGFFSCLLMLRRNDNYYESIDDLSGFIKKPSNIIFFSSSYSFFISWNTTSCRFFC
jgi:NADH-quinone oxidoreductase subunit N